MSLKRSKMVSFRLSPEEYTRFRRGLCTERDPEHFRSGARGDDRDRIAGGGDRSALRSGTGYSNASAVYLVGIGPHFARRRIPKGGECLMKYTHPIPGHLRTWALPCVSC